MTVHSQAAFSTNFKSYSSTSVKNTSFIWSNLALLSRHANKNILNTFCKIWSTQAMFHKKRNKNCPQAFWKSDFTFTGLLWGLIVSWHLEKGFPKITEFCLYLAWLISLWGCYKSIFCLCYRSGNTDFSPFAPRVWTNSILHKSGGCREPCMATPGGDVSMIQRAPVLCVSVAWRLPEIF